MMKFRNQLLMLLAVIFLFGSFNFSLYMLLTRRLSNNFDDATTTHQVDVGMYLPFEEKSDLARVDTDFRLTGDLPILDGAAALVPVYAAIVDNVYPEGSVKYEGGSFSSDNYYGENFADDSAMVYNNTVRGYKAIVDGTTDILFCAGPSADQKQYAREQGVELIYVTVGLEGFVFFVNARNPVEDLTTDQIRKIYAAEYTNWNQVGGPNRVINPVTRLAGSGSQTAFESFMGDTPIGRKSLLAFTGGSIGFSFRYYMDGIVDNSGVKMLKLNGVYPSAEDIQNRTYPIVAQFYAIYRADNENENIRPLIDWLLSEEGQNLIEESGYVKINP